MFISKLEQQESDLCECDKYYKHSTQIFSISEFLEYAESQGIYLQTEQGNYISGEDLCYAMFGIDRKKLEKERKKILKSLKKERANVV